MAQRKPSMVAAEAPADDSTIKYMDLREFVSEGFLQEANRLFFHPLGLALSVSFDKASGRPEGMGIWDYREDPEGMIFGDDMIEMEKIGRVHVERMKHDAARKKMWGQSIQPPFNRTAADK